jgi:serine/threonine-protein kinase
LHAVVGTPSYMAPEQAQGEKAAVTTATDVYGLGGILYALLTGQPPFRGDSVLETLRHVREREPESPRARNPRVGRDLDTICLKCLRKEPERRYSSAEELAADLERFLAGEAIRARAVGWGERAWRWCRRKPAVAGLLGGVALSLLAGTGMATYFAVRADAARADESRRRERARQALDVISSHVVESSLAQQKQLSSEDKQFLQQILAYYEEFAAETGQDEATRAGVAKANFRVGSIRERLGQLAEAQPVFERARDLYAALAADFPAEADYESALARSQNRLGKLLTAIGRPKHAEAAFRDALPLYKQLAADFPTLPDHQNELASALGNLGRLFVEREEYVGARRVYDEAFPHHQAALRTNPHHPVYRQAYRNSRDALAEALLALGDHRAAAAAASQLMEAAVHPAIDPARAARHLARCAPLAERDPQLSDAKRRETAQGYADKAMAALRHAVQNGLRYAASMRKDPALDALRNRADFKQLLAEQEAGPKSGAGR